MPTAIALLRAVNVGGHNRVSMAELRSLCSGLGWVDVRTYIQSGNLVFRSADAPALLERQLEDALERHLGMTVPVLVRSREEWLGYVTSNPLLDLAQAEPERVMLALSRNPPPEEAISRIRARATAEERVERLGDALWIHFPAGSSRSRLTPGLLDRLVGSPVTTRNWRTVLKLREMADAADG